MRSARLVRRLPIVLLAGFVANGCGSSEPAVVGSWITQSEAGSGMAYDCSDLGTPADMVSISATASGGFTYSTEENCQVAGFAFDVSQGTTDLEIVFQVVPAGAPPPPNTVTVNGPIDSDVDLGVVHLTPQTPTM